jgi:photosystem II stability/assembly factor-like uncharacterized protein
MTGYASMSADAMDQVAELQDMVSAVTASPAFATDRTCFAARFSGLYGSTDGGKTWQALYGSLGSSAPLPTTGVAVSPAYPSDHTVFAATQGGILRSHDAGRSWEAVLLPAPPPLVVALAISPRYIENGVLFAGTAQDGVCRSADRGSRWAAWNFGLFDLSVLCMAVSPVKAADETLYVGTESGIFRSTNGGRAWREVPFPAEMAPVSSLALSPGYVRDGTLWAGTDENGLYRSHDRGQSWERMAADTIAGAVNAVLLGADYPTRPAMLVLAEEGLLLSADGGKSWQEIMSDDLADREMTCVAAPLGLEPGAPVLVGTDDGAVLQLELPESA